MLRYQILAYTIHKRIQKKSQKNNKLKILSPTWNYNFKLLDRSYSVLDCQNYFEYIIKKLEPGTDNPPIRIYVNKTENRITFKCETGYYFRLLTQGTMKLLRSKKSKITKSENGEQHPYLEIIEAVLINCIISNNDYQHDSKVLYTFISNK